MLTRDGTAAAAVRFLNALLSTIAGKRSIKNTQEKFKKQIPKVKKNIRDDLNGSVGLLA